MAISCRPMEIVKRGVRLPIAIAGLMVSLTRLVKGRMRDMPGCARPGRISEIRRRTVSDEIVSSILAWNISPAHGLQPCLLSYPRLPISVEDNADPLTHHFRRWQYRIETT